MSFYCALILYIQAIKTAGLCQENNHNFEDNLTFFSVLIDLE